MPNPLMRSGVPNRSTQPPNRPTPVEPTPEHVTGANFPYRGYETHGVAVPNHRDGDEIPSTWENTTDAYFELPYTDDRDPVPVRVVHEDSGRERRITRFHRYPVTRYPRQILTRNDHRVSCNVRARGNINPVPQGAQTVIDNRPVGDNTTHVMLPGVSGRLQYISVFNNDTATFVVVLDDQNSGVTNIGRVSAAANAFSAFNFPDVGLRFTNGFPSRTTGPTTNPVNVAYGVVPDQVTTEIRVAQNQSECNDTEGYALLDNTDTSLNLEDELWAYAPTLADGQVAYLYVREDISVHLPSSAY